jgi:hypothetical protein
MAEATDTKKDSKEEKDTKTSTSKKDGFEVVKVPGSSLEVKRVDTEDKNFTENQDQALLDYKVTGVVGSFADPTRDQEPDIAPEFGVAPHPELHNPAPPTAAVGAEARETITTASIEDKVKADDPLVAVGQISGKTEPS